MIQLSRCAEIIVRYSAIGICKIPRYVDFVFFPAYCNDIPRVVATGCTFIDVPALVGAFHSQLTEQKLNSPRYSLTYRKSLS